MVPAPPPMPSGAVARAPRLEIPIDLVLTPIDAKPFPPTAMVTRDLSATGAFVVTEIVLKIGDTVSVEIQLPTSGTLEQVSHTVRARVVRRIDRGYGLTFIEPPAALIAAVSALVVVDGG